MIDDNGYRENVGIILLNDKNMVLCGRRTGMLAWQMPQGGIEEGESPEVAMYRELEEEIGLRGKYVDLLGATKNWLYYNLPERYQRVGKKPRCIGQKQIWFLLKFKGDDSNICLDLYQPQEFEDWNWFDYWKPIEMIIDFKKAVYREALTELEILF